MKLEDGNKYSKVYRQKVAEQLNLKYFSDISACGYENDDFQNNLITYKK